MSILPDTAMLKLGWDCRCPRCHEGALYKPGVTLELNEKCPHCGLDLQKNDSADGPAVFLIFILGATLVPLALIIDAIFHWPILVHGFVWSVAALGLTLGALRPLKAYIIALQFKHRASDWE